MSASDAGLDDRDAALVRDIAGRDPTARRRAVARAITLVESTKPEHRARAEALLTALPAASIPATRVGVSGVPGVGKSTFIETLGGVLTSRGHRVAVLAVDPSSALSGGSILGDKTRMEKLASDANAFVRPSPSGATLGGVAAATRDAMRVVESAGFDVVLVETVGIGQSEAAVAGMTDAFVLLQLPNAGDELQAIKKGVLEWADVAIVNKADLDAAAAARAVGQLESAGRSAMRCDGAAPLRAVAASALDAASVAGAWSMVDAFVDAQRRSGAFAARRASQIEAALRERVESGMRERFAHDAEVRRLWPELLAEASAERLPVAVAARRLLDAFAR